MAAGFCDWKGVLMVEFMQQGTTVIIRSVLWDTKRIVQGHSEQKAWNACIQHTCSVPWQCVSAYSCLHLSTTATFQLGVVWPPFLQPCSCSDWLPPVHLKNWLRSQCFNNNELMKGVKTWLSSQEENLTQAHKNLFPDTSVSIPVVTALKSSLSMYVLFVHNTIFFSLLVLLTPHWRLLSE
jgi:hypothetical protein